MSTEPTVFVVDDDVAICESLECLLGAEGFRTRTFDSAEAFLAEYDQEQPGCLVLDVRMRGMTGLELHERLTHDGITIPVIILTGHGDIPMAVRATQAGVVDFLEKPVNDQVLLQRVRDALERDAELLRRSLESMDFAERLAQLTPREREVMELVVAGNANKQTAVELGIAEKTVEVHRRRVMRKMGLRGAATLVRMVLEHRSRTGEFGTR